MFTIGTFTWTRCPLSAPDRTKSDARLFGAAPEEVGSWYVEGIGEDFIPDNCDLGLVSLAYTISDKEAFNAARQLLTKEGIIAGGQMTYNPKYGEYPIWPLDLDLEQIISKEKSIYISPMVPGMAFYQINSILI